MRGRRVLVVGASGFVGQVVVRDLRRRGYAVGAASRSPGPLPDGATFVPLPDLSRPDLPWDGLLAGTDAVVYLAARVHVMNDIHPDPPAAYRAVNHGAALSLARAAARAGVRRFVYLSSVKVNGESSARPLTEADPPNPLDAYGVSKLAAETDLLALGAESGLEVVVVRPPLVYGPGVKANFMALARAAGRGLPLPIGGVRNRRSMVYVENLADLIATVLEHPAAAGQVYFASDDHDLSTPELTRQLAQAQGRRARLPAVPVALLALAGRLTGRSAVVSRLTGSLQVSPRKAREELDWTPPYPVWQALARTARGLEAGASGAVRASSVLTPSVMTSSQTRYLALRYAAERVVAALALLLLGPALLALALLIRLDAPGPSIFRQERAGRHHRPFVMYKYRTMHVGTPQLSTEDMQRRGPPPTTRLGALLRRSSLDELPQLLNVVRGEMALIGPRPALLSQHTVLGLREISGVDVLRPGLTGSAQVAGRDDLSDQDKVAREVQYLRTLGPARDWAILRATVTAVLRGTGTR